MNIINPTGMPYIRLYRFELFCKGEAQNMGFLAGLDGFGLPYREEKHLLAPFDSMLKVPDVIDMKGFVSFFTPLGVREFAGSIQAVISAYKENDLFDVVLHIADVRDVDLETTVYADVYQVCLPEHPYAPVTTLLPCPCGGIPILEDWISGWETGTTIRCPKCGAIACEGVENGNGWHDKAILNWNQRCKNPNN